MTTDTQTQGLVMDGHPRIVQDTQCILGVLGYSDTGASSHGWTSSDVWDTPSISSVWGY